MKRSNLVQILADYLYDELEDVHWFGENVDKVADRVVQKMEEAGMLPPTIELSACGSRIPTTKLLDYAEIDYVTTWEPEDES